MGSGRPFPVRIGIVGRANKPIVCVASHVSENLGTRGGRLTFSLATSWATAHGMGLDWTPPPLSPSAGTLRPHRQIS